MAKIENSKPKTNSGGYERLFGDKQLGNLITKLQSTVITNGTELESIILKLLQKESRLIENADDLFNKNLENVTYLISKKAIKNSKKLSGVLQEPDFLVLKVENRHCYCSPD